MKKNLLFRFPLALLAILLFSRILMAAPVDPATATSVGKHFFQATKKGNALAEHVALNLVYGNEDQLAPGAPHLFYVFNVNDVAGFVIVAADDAVTPILGYSTSGAFDPANIPVNMEKWLEKCRHEIFYVVEHHITPTDAIAQTWKTLRMEVPSAPEAGGVGPLLTTTWNQTTNYNTLCPAGSVTGCGATAMAQVMKFWNHPLHGYGVHSYLEDDYGVLTANFGAVNFAFDQMPNQVNTVNIPVAVLMYHCGISLDMNYSPAGSGCNPAAIPNALKTYFGYDPSCRIVVKSNYTETAWIALLKAELDAGRPVQHNGFGSGGGHAFVCDGYDNNNLFHINWGWGGVSDGYFATHTLNPSALGTGGGTGGGFSDDQSATIGIKPSTTPLPNLGMFTAITVSPSPAFNQESYAINCLIKNNSNQPFDGKLTAGVFNDSDGTLVGYLDSVPVSLISEGFAAYSTNGVMQLVPGFYRYAMMYKPKNSNVWTQIPNTSIASVAEVTVQSHSPMACSAAISAAPSPVVQNTPMTVSAFVENFSAFPSFTGEIEADLHYPDGSFVAVIGKKSGVSLLLGQTETLVFPTNGLNVTPGLYKIVLWAKRDGGSWELVNPHDNFESNINISVLAPRLQADPYEPNEEDVSGFPLALNFTNDVAYVSTPGSNFNSGIDHDYFYLVLDPGYTYTIKPRVHDFYNSGNGNIYTNDVRWSYRAGTANQWSESYDDVLLAPGMSFSTPSVDYVDFHITSFYAGNLGTYLFEAEVKRQLISAVEELLPEQAISIFPNPASRFATVTMMDADLSVKTIHLYTLNGQLVHTQTAGKDQHNRIPTGQLPNGIYIVSVVTETGVWNSKLSVAH